MVRQIQSVSGAATLLLVAVHALASGASPTTAAIPSTVAKALDGHTVTLPSQNGARATVLIVGFGRHSSTATTAWEKPVRTQLAHGPAVGFYDMAMLAEVPGFMRPLVTRMIRDKVPPVLQPNFVPLTADESAWKQAAGYAPDQPEAAYVLVVDRAGRVRWSTRDAFTPRAFAALQGAVSRVLAD